MIYNIFVVIIWEYNIFNIITLCNHIVCSIKKVLNKSIKLGGSSINNYSMVSGKLGDYQNKLEVYGREGLICRKRTCKSKILRIVIAQRSTFYCPVCQK